MINKVELYIKLVSDFSFKSCNEIKVLIWIVILQSSTALIKGSDGLIGKVSASQPWDRGFESHTGHDYDSPHDTSTGWFQEADSRVI